MSSTNTGQYRSTVNPHSPSKRTFAQIERSQSGGDSGIESAPRERNPYSNNVHSEGGLDKPNIDSSRVSGSHKHNGDARPISKSSSALRDQGWERSPVICEPCSNEKVTLCQVRDRVHACKRCKSLRRKCPFSKGGLNDILEQAAKVRPKERMDMKQGQAEAKAPSGCLPDNVPLDYISRSPPKAAKELSKDSNSPKKMVPTTLEVLLETTAKKPVPAKPGPKQVTKKVADEPSQPVKLKPKEHHPREYPAGPLQSKAAKTPDTTTKLVKEAKFLKELYEQCGHLETSTSTGLLFLQRIPDDLPAILESVKDRAELGTALKVLESVGANARHAMEYTKRALEDATIAQNELKRKWDALEKGLHAGDTGEPSCKRGPKHSGN
ncbi:hypothetical protein SISNIDRAFT_459960 [Sistotremastrum niveocremeum HHB9708]|uniref:Uncharacterized protein n=1 Tax=Sistotremastrum niveocremeum HHB9708 TaxID=1314777 RepID=A0A164P1B2_9AGAM|nr:hypothetical protein SISNIDRAFT_459960 [Sistotremastrum niveocremeum HHB9708]